MKTLRHLVTLSALLALVVAPSWARPQHLDNERLAALQMQGATAEDHLKVAAHFRAEAEDFEQQAETHDAMAKRYNRSNLPPKVASLNTGMSRHCMNLSRALKEAAKEAKLLADGHKTMADHVGK